MHHTWQYRTTTEKHAPKIDSNGLKPLFRLDTHKGSDGAIDSGAIYQEIYMSELVQCRLNHSLDL